MKKLLFMAFGLLLSINIHAQSTNVSLRRPSYGGTLKPQHAPALLPTLCYEGTAFTLTAPYDIEDLEIVISDVDGNTLYYNKVDVSAGSFIFYVPSEILDEMVLIELYYGNTYLYGDL
jgi:hypothetical protein